MWKAGSNLVNKFEISSFAEAVLWKRPEMRRSGWTSWMSKGKKRPLKKKRNSCGIYLNTMNNLQAQTPPTWGFIEDYVSFVSLSISSLTIFCDFFPPKIAVPPKQMVKEVDKSRRTQCILHFQTFTSPSDPQVRLHLLPFDCHFTISSSFFPPPSLTHSLEKYHFWGGFPHVFLHIDTIILFFFFPSSFLQRFPKHFC